MIMIWKKMNLKSDARQMQVMCGAMLVLLFLMMIWVPVISNLLGLICILLFEWYLFLNRKKLLVDRRFVILLFAMLLYVVIYNCQVENMGLGETINLALLPPLFYLLGKQLLYYPQERKSSGRRMWTVIGVILAGHFVLSWLEIYTFYLNPKYPARIWDEFWTGEQFYATQYSFLAVVWVSLLFYGIKILKKKTLLGIGLLVGIFIINVLNIFAGNRMQVGVLLAVFMFSLLIFLLQNRSNRKLLLWFMGVGGILFAVFVIIFIFDVGSIRGSRYISHLLDLTTDVRFEIYRNAVRQMPFYPWGGTQMDLGVFAHAHNMWLQMYNESGIISFLPFCIFTIMNILDWIRIITKTSMEEDIKYVIPPICLGIFLYLTFERGGRNYIICYTFFAGMAAQLLQEEKGLRDKVKAKGRIKD